MIIKEKKIIINSLIKDENIKINNNILDILHQKIELLKILTNSDELEYKGKLQCLYNNSDIGYCIYHLIVPKKVVGKNRILIGDESDGGYILYR